MLINVLLNDLECVIARVTLQDILRRVVHKRSSEDILIEYLEIA